MRRVRRDGSYASARDPRVHFGLGRQTEVRSLRVDWPDGRATLWQRVQARRHVTIRQTPLAGEGADVSPARRTTLPGAARGRGASGSGRRRLPPDASRRPERTGGGGRRARGGVGDRSRSAGAVRRHGRRRLAAARRVHGARLDAEPPGAGPRGAARRAADRGAHPVAAPVDDDADRQLAPRASHSRLRPLPPAERRAGADLQQRAAAARDLEHGHLWRQERGGVRPVGDLSGGAGQRDHGLGSPVHLSLPGGVAAAAHRPPG